ncbi:hypothetical protein ACFOOM_00900 [Streptomyces echinoruber]|uniref:Uncharacterized protein n=1 Tax=Streptomyces echinoruber TaxID=68898 RepID=A0A918V7P2_9ACTN|nr:hypothetical protein [Streptomyces echinoruber]GGZ73270.1 hypothetical protein GCM10010389_08540 [Streptomyces echinoruber]
MGCGCGKQRTVVTASGARVPAPLYKVVLQGGEGAVVFQTHDLAKARTVNKNYPGSVIDPDPDAAQADESPAADATQAGETAEAAPGA